MKRLYNSKSENNNSGPLVKGWTPPFTANIGSTTTMVCCGWPLDEKKFKKLKFKSVDNWKWLWYTKARLPREVGTKTFENWTRRTIVQGATTCCSTEQQNNKSVSDRNEWGTQTLMRVWSCSGRTLAACLIHASRTLKEELAFWMSCERVSNAQVTCLVKGDNYWKR